MKTKVTAISKSRDFTSMNMATILANWEHMNSSLEVWKSKKKVTKGKVLH